MRLAAPVWLLAALMSLCAFGGCAGCSGTHAASTVCTLDDGTTLNAGESGPKDCNTCVCNAQLELVCTQRSCNDAGPPPNDAGPEDAGTDGGVDAGPVDEGPCHDTDHDGYYTCIDPNFPDRKQFIDCDDERFHVQPGGVEFPDTPEDDNCDGHNDDYVACDCNGSSANARDLGAAMDLCGDVVTSATKNGQPIQFGIVRSYRNVIDARVRARIDTPTSTPVIIGNDCLATLSSGDATGTQTDVDAASGSFSDPDPASDHSAQVFDLAQIHFTLHVPANATGFAFDFMFLSQEWPEFLCLEFNDTFYAIVDTPAVASGQPTNAAFDSDGRPVTVNVGFFEDPADWTVPLTGTPVGAVDSLGFGCPSPSAEGFQTGCQLPSYCADPNLEITKGSGSGWLTTKVPVVPGQSDLQLTLSIHDEGDGIYDSLVLLDAFRWLQGPVTLQTSKAGG